MAQLVVILLIAGFGYAAYKFYKALYTPIVLTPEDVDHIQPQSVVDENALKEAQEQALAQLQEAQTQIQGMVKKIDDVLANNVDASIPQEVASELASIEKLKDELASAQAAASAQVAASTPAPVGETTPKPAKKKRRYYPKKK
jgi:predicted phage tail protein